MCTQCKGFKGRLKFLQHQHQAHQQTLAGYMKHLAQTWLDRQCASNTVELGMSCFALWIPKQVDKTHAFQTLIRPAIHVQGAWWQGMAYHLALGDGDVMKNTNNNVEALARLLCTGFERSSRRLPLGLVIKQDNCMRERKNGKLVKFCLALVGLSSFRSPLATRIPH